jgi:hypothetical protein
MHVFLAETYNIPLFVNDFFFKSWLGAISLFINK